ncbi:MAG: hypothetical protein JXA81_06305 [Sedimentisphaerales bacterium]|nr:hypothetical protein [Sedimentisphaerales bacterium]
MQRQKIVITLDAKDLQDVERIVADRDGALAVEFVRKVIKPRVDDVLDKGHCKPIFESRRGQPEKIEPPQIKDM